MNVFYKTLCLLFLCHCLQGQTPYFRQHPFSTEFKNIVVNTMLETADGFIWVGTSNGLFRYDGLEFKSIPTIDTFLIAEVTALFEDDQRNVWVGTKSGQIYFLEKDLILKPWDLEEGRPAQKITGFEKTANGIFWISTYGGGAYYYKDDRLYNLDESDGLLGMEIYSMIRHRENHILLATDAGISVCKIENEEKQIHTLTTQNGLSDEIVKILLKGTDGNFWAGTYDHGVDFWNAEKQIFQQLIPNWEFGEINHLEVFQEREIWIGTEGNGLFRYDFSTGHLQQIDLPFFKNSKIYDLHKDVEGNLWVLNNKVGMSSANRQFEQVDHQLGNVQTVLIDKQNKVWFGTPTGLFQMEYTNQGQQTFKPIFQNKKINVISLFEDVNGMIWIGTFGQGLYCYNQDQQELDYFSKEQGLMNDNILSIDGSNKTLWLATLGGVYEIDIGLKINPSKMRFRNYTNEDGLGTDFIYKTFVDSKNRTWFGTDGKGISILENEKITNYDQANGIPLKAVYNITEDHKGNIWLSTGEHGIFEFDGENFSQLNIKEGIRDLEINSMITDDLGNILIVHPSGIDILNPKTKHLIYYDDEVGLEDLEPVLNAVGKDKLGNIWIGAKDKLIRYSALNEPLEIHPRTQIEQVNLVFEPVNYHKVSSFSHNQNDLVFHYIGLWYSDPEKVEYRYQLQGYNPNWIYSKDQQANYPDLRPGNYTFKVTSTENGVFNGEPVAKYSFEIKAPFWQRSWFLILTVLLFFGLGYAWTQWKSRRLKQEADLEKERVQSQLEVLKSQINPHFLFNSFNTLITLIEDEPELATEYVEKLSDFYRSLLQYREKDLIPLQEELELLRNFGFLLEKRFGENLHLEIPYINGQVAFVPPLTLQILVENAVKHNVISKKKPLKISLEIKEDKIRITNNLQEKITKEKSTHFGLQSIQSRYDLLDAKEIRIEKTANEFIVTIPILNK